MKKSRLLVIVAAVLAAAAGAVGGLSYAANVYTKSANAHVKIVSSNTNIGIYSDAAATQSMTLLEFGSVGQGSAGTLTFYVKNLGGVQTTISQGTTSLPSPIGTLSMTFDGQSQETLNPGQISTVVATISSSASAALGDVNFSIVVNFQAGSGATTTTTTTTTPTTVSYSATIQPILNGCAGCHGSGGSAGVNLTSYSSVMSTAGVVAGNASSSMLYNAVMGNGMSKMPPGGSLTTAQITAIQNWINQGALNN